MMMTTTMTKSREVSMITFGGGMGLDEELEKEQYPPLSWGGDYSTRIC